MAAPGGKECVLLRTLPSAPAGDRSADRLRVPRVALLLVKSEYEGKRKNFVDAQEPLNNVKVGTE